MYVYKFRLLFDDVEDFVRDYEILSKQNFKDFHHCIIESIKGLNTKELASFFICDRKWTKKQEITLVEMIEDDENDKACDENKQLEANNPIVSMENAILSDFIDDPHQRIIYEYDFLHLKTFYIELLKSYEASPNKKYPICTYSSGEIPQKETLITHENEIFEEDSIQSILDDMENDNEAYYDESELDGFNADFEDNNL